MDCEKVTLNWCQNWRKNKGNVVADAAFDIRLKDKSFTFDGVATTERLSSLGGALHAALCAKFF